MIKFFFPATAVGLWRKWSEPLSTRTPGTRSWSAVTRTGSSKIQSLVGPTDRPTTSTPADRLISNQTDNRVRTVVRDSLPSARLIRTVRVSSVRVSSVRVSSVRVSSVPVSTVRARTARVGTRSRIPFCRRSARYRSTTTCGACPDCCVKSRPAPVRRPVITSPVITSKSSSSPAYRSCPKMRWSRELIYCET